MPSSPFSRLLSPVSLTLPAIALYLSAALWQAGGDPLRAARILPGASWSPEGYDGQFTYFIARDPNPETVAPFLDVPAYRYQRILLPLLARVLSFGSVPALPWVLWLIGVAAHLWGTWLAGRLLEGYGLPPRYALIYGLWVGFLLAARLDLPEPLAYALIGAGMLYGETRSPSTSDDSRPPFRASPVKWIMFALAVFAKEVAILFVAAQLLVDLSRRDWKNFAGMGLVGVLPYAAFQGWLLLRFGQVGLASGGDMATGFEIIPFMGWLRIAEFGLPALLAFGAVIVPFFYLPAVWGFWAAVTRRAGAWTLEAAALALNALVIPFLPFSTVREPGGLFRFGSGLALALLLFAAKYRQKRALRYAWLWLALNAILFNT